MPLYKGVYQFRTNTGATWNEVWVNENATLADAAFFPEAFIQLRLKLLNTLNKWVKVRVSEIGKPRVSTIVNIGRSGLDASGGVGEHAPANIAEAAVVGLSSTVQPSSRKWWLRGMDEAAVSRSKVDGSDIVNPVFAQALQDWINEIGKAGTSFVVLPITKVGAGAVISVDVTRVDGTAANGQCVLTCTAPPLVLPGDIIILSQFNKKEFPALNGRFTVLATAGNTVTIPYATPENTLLIPLSGKAKKLVFVSGAKIDKAASAFLYLGSRKTKNPATGSRGAARAQRIRKLA